MASSRYGWHMSNFHETNLRILVTIQEMTSHTNKMKRELTLSPDVKWSGLMVPRTLKVTIYRKISGVGCPRRIRPRTTTLLMRPSRMELLNGSSMVAHSRSGSQQDRCSGFAESVRPFAFQSIAIFKISWSNKLVAGSGKTILSYVSSQACGFTTCSRSQLAQL